EGLSAASVFRKLLTHGSENNLIASRCKRLISRACLKSKVRKRRADSRNRGSQNDNVNVNGADRWRCIDDPYLYISRRRCAVIVCDYRSARIGGYHCRIS